MDVTVLSADSLPVRVAIVVPQSDLLPSAVEVEVLASSADGTRLVRTTSASWRVPASGGAYIEDMEVELGIPVTYQARQFNAAGVDLGLTAGATVQVGIVPGEVIIQDPLAPGSWVQVVAEADFASTLERQRERTLYRRGDATVALMGRLGLLESVTLTSIALSGEASARLEKVLEQGYILVRAMPSTGLPGCLHAVAPVLRKSPWRGGADDVDLWELSADQVSSSRVPIIESPVTYARFMAAFPTYAAAKAVYATYLDAFRNPPPEL